MGPRPLDRRRWRTRTAAVVSLASAAVVLSACRQILDIKEREEAVHENPDAAASATGMCGAFTYTAQSCASCMDNACCDALAACHDDTTCQPTFQCLAGCAPSDAECGLRCLSSFARGNTLADLLSCRAQQCDAPCTLQGGGLPYSFDACNECVATSCGDMDRACATNADCLKLDFCDKNCLPAGSITCSHACQTLYPGGTDALAARDSCADDTCASACAPEQAWSCLDAPLAFLKPTKLDPITVTMAVVDFITNKAYPGLTVKACTRADAPCASPLATATTDAMGGFTMTIPLGNAGFDGYLDVSGPAVFPALYYFVPPLLVGGDRGQLRLPSADTMPMLVGFLSAKLDPTRGHLAVVPLDCSFSSAPGVSLSVDTADAMSTPYYFVQGLPNKGAMQTDPDPALGGFINLPPMPARVRATVPSHGNAESAEFLFNIRPGTLTTGTVSPLPK